MQHLNRRNFLKSLLAIPIAGVSVFIEEPWVIDSRTKNILYTGYLKPQTYDYLDLYRYLKESWTNEISSSN